MSKIKEKLNKLPNNPGVYTFFGAAESASGGQLKNGPILYIGKATNLKNRVNSYLQGRNERGMRIVSMVAQIADIKIQETDSVLEALILESNLIKKFQPKYNVERKDDKSFNYVTISRETYPRIEIVRESNLYKNKKSKIKNKNYNLKLKNSKLILNSKLEIRNSNIYGPYTSKKQLEIALKIIRKIFPYHSNKQKTEKGCLDFQLGRCPGPYAGAISKEDYAQNIRGIRMILEGKKKNLLKSLEREMRDQAKKNEFEKAAELRNKIFALRHIQDVALMTSENFSLTPALSRRERGNEEEKLRIEAYDISNISGQYAVGSMVVFSNGEPDKSQYRKFKIKTIEGSNDVGMMAEVLFRRFRHSEWPKPDLILLDGGKGHVNMGSKILQELSLEIPMAGIAKGPGRKNVKIQMTNDKSMSKSKFQKYILEILKDKNLIQGIMNEAHRFAISYHKKLRKRNFLVN